jgi:hypothetical protein
MKRLLVSILLSCAFAAPAYAACTPPPTQVPVVYSWVYFQPTSGGTRYPSRGAGSASLTPIPQAGAPFSYALSPACAPGQQYASVTFPTVVGPFCASCTAAFGLEYVNVSYAPGSGGPGADVTVFPVDGSVQTLSVQMPVSSATSQIDVQAAYFPIGGGCPPGTACPQAAYIDEFNETAGQLADDLFVTVFSPESSTSANSSLTVSGNDQGVVAIPSTSNDSNVRINAYQSTASAGSFDRWVSGPGGTVGSDPHNLDVTQTDYALALYRAPCPSDSYLNEQPGISQCVAIPSCPPGEEWDSQKSSCVSGPRKCPPQCHYGCIPPPPTGSGTFTCLPAPGTGEALFRERPRSVLP